MKEKGYRIATDPGSLTSVLQCVSDVEARKLAYIQGNSMPDANLDILEKLIAARDELARIMGCKSYAEFAVRPNMASSSDVVMAFLHEMSSMVRPQADEEFRRLRDFKRAKTGQISDDLEPWDETYFSAMIKASNYNLDCSGDLGYLYLDLYSRKDKYTGCAHFAIKGGRRISGAEYQLSVVALVCNFSNSSDLSSTRLNHGEVETLFHEFGHALHSLLSRTEYQHFSGTRVALDLAETPSNLFEYYAWDYRFLKKFARHYSTGEVIPEKLVKSMQDARSVFAATELQRQIFYALIDQKLFGEHNCPPRDTITIVADLKRQHTSYKQVEGTHWHTRFSHLLNYGGGYYSYLYAKCFSATIWKKCARKIPCQ